ncbi:unnamed protein product [Pseudo-nitzschia multistriata]|uniref:Uncharacterized protein n=1 Tax=Pseudo-nitzschia multistriata TaxID=183589 RepID=A0A448ZAX6_9STRA|nr:unnamed protein product [Pseudo-nitzschia multistriata]
MTRCCLDPRSLLKTEKKQKYTETHTNDKELDIEPFSSLQLCDEYRDGLPEETRRIHMNHLRNITDRLLREQLALSTCEDHSYPNEIKFCNKGRSRSWTVQSRSQHDSKDGRESIQTLEPWVESSIAKSVDDKHQQSDSITENATLCTAFELLSTISCGNMCDRKKSMKTTPPKKNPPKKYDDDLKVVGPLIPREISFENRGAFRNGMPREELVIKAKRKKFLKKLLDRSGSIDRSTKVKKVRVYVDPPKRTGGNNSVGNSTVTWPTVRNEF